MSCKCCSSKCPRRAHYCSDKCRILANIIGDLNSQCWLWLGATNKQGYGMLCMGANVNVRAHRLSFEAFVGPIPDGLHVLHRCDTPQCVNPEHLFVGTNLQNMQDSAAKARRSQGEAHHAARLTAEQVAEIRSSTLLNRQIMAAFGVSRSHVQRIRNGKTRRKS